MNAPKNAMENAAGTGEIERRLRAAGEERDRDRAQADRLRVALEEAASEREALRARLRDLEAKAAQASDRARADAQVIRGLQERLRMVEDSTSFRLGHALVLGAKSPSRLARLWREFRYGRPARPAHRPSWARAAVLTKLRPDPAQQLTVLEAVPPPDRGPSSRSAAGWSTC